MKSRSRTSVLVLVAAALLLASCASPPKVRVDKDTSTNFASYKTFGWLGSQRAPAAAEVVPGQAAAPAAPEMNSLTTNRVRNAVTAVLQAKGYVFDEAHPDFKVGYALNVYEHQKDSGMRIGLGAGGGGGHAGGSVGVSIPVGATKNLMGTMTIDIIDGARNAQVWTGSYEQKVQGENISDEDANRIVSIILTYFPHDPPKK
jgi:Domain of unknown function (DUF4136)